MNRPQNVRPILQLKSNRPKDSTLRVQGGPNGFDLARKGRKKNTLHMKEVTKRASQKLAKGIFFILSPFDEEVMSLSTLIQVYIDKKHSCLPSTNKSNFMMDLYERAYN